MRWCVLGDDEGLVRELSGQLSGRGVRTEPELADEGPPLGLVVVEARGGSPLSREARLDEARRAVTLRGGELVLVTERSERDVGLRALRRSGMPYTVVRRPALAATRRVPLAVLPNTLARPVASDAALAAELAATVAEGATGTGATLELGLTTEGRLVAHELGAWAHALPRPLFLVLAWLGVPALDADGRGSLRRLEPWRLPARAWLRLGGLVALLALTGPSVAHALPAACAGAESAEARVARLARLAVELAPDDRTRALAADARAGAHRAAIETLFERLRAAANELAPTARDRLTRARLVLGADPALPDAALHRGCGPDHLADDAWVNGALDLVVLCPGFVLLEDELARGPDRSDAVASASAFLLAHELGHVILGRASGPDAERAADALAGRILARIEGLDLPSALRPFCGLAADGAHDDGPARIENALELARPLSAS